MPLGSSSFFFVESKMAFMIRLLFLSTAYHSRRKVIRRKTSNYVLCFFLFSPFYLFTQLQSSFGSQLQLTDSKSLIIKPEEDLPVNILYAPTMVTAAQGLLVMKPVGGCSKYTVSPAKCFICLSFN